MQYSCSFSGAGEKIASDLVFFVGYTNFRNHGVDHAVKTDQQEFACQNKKESIMLTELPA